eukprot:2375470-Prymnesium_polylepis.1
MHRSTVFGDFRAASVRERLERFVPRHHERREVVLLHQAQEPVANMYVEADRVRQTNRAIARCDDELGHARQSNLVRRIARTARRRQAALEVSSRRAHGRSFLPR